MKKLLLLVCLIISFGAIAQESDLGNWIIYFGNKQIDTKWNWHHEVQYRNYDAVGDLEQLLLRTGIGYNLTENNNNLLFGYGFIRSDNYLADNEEKVTVNEHRIYQQFITKQSIGRVGVQHRYRFEQRFVESDFRMRFRYFLALSLPLNNPKMQANTWYLSAYNEIFLNTKADAFDRNRLYGGVGYRFSPIVRVEVGYMNQFFNRGGRDQINMILGASF